MTLSIIIVNYNTGALLEECLRSVEEAARGLLTEVVVVDNCSTDQSMEGVALRFPRFHIIRNNFNAGFAKANNQGLKIVTGRFVLFLNPDTIVPPDCFRKCLQFMETHPDAGAMGIKMVNGNGVYLKESKRGFPSPAVACYKLTGLTAMFPRSRIFARYYLGHLNENQDHEIEVLSGAFMLAKKQVLDQVGGFDERFFMYAEDIDLSYRILKAGFRNYYFAGTTLLHYKGGSTQKDRRYVKQFYRAMSQFVKKYYGTGPYSMLLDLAIWLRAGIEMIFPRRNNTSRPSEVSSAAQDQQGDNGPTG